MYSGTLHECAQLAQTYLEWWCVFYNFLCYATHLAEHDLWSVIKYVIRSPWKMIQGLNALLKFRKKFVT